MTDAGDKPSYRRRLSAALRERLAARRAFSDQAIALAHLVGRPVLDSDGTRIGKVADIVVRWERGVAYPPVTGVLVPLGRGFAVIDHQALILSQTGARLRGERNVVSHPIRREGDVALARDILDRQLVDIAGVQVVRASEVYLLNGPNGWELAGVDVGLRSLCRRLLPRRRRCPPVDRVIDWAELHAFVPRFTDTSSAWESGPAMAAGAPGSGVQLGNSVAGLKTLRAKDVAAIMAGLPRSRQADLAVLAEPAAAAEALAWLDREDREALLAELAEPDRNRLRALMIGRGS
ncbi:PRC-barrel domain-containing protein [Mycobacterium sp.]|uniref:PRC-barrel domain-containing protein n=1 Tax=Mycobacterium sp. TaxID=1785 RepID=UPI0025FE6D5D|nr:PRC-barrel domain-containing protein [Mycobacterium sp.]MBW0012868.1 PRC-barrel domain-containing protein [Mycobacterium sp.]